MPREISLKVNPSPGTWLITLERVRAEGYLFGCDRGPAFRANHARRISTKITLFSSIVWRGSMPSPLLTKNLPPPLNAAPHTLAVGFPRSRGTGVH